MPFWEEKHSQDGDVPYSLRSGDGRMISKERREELEAIALEIFEACDWFEPSERGAGWAPTDKGYENVIHVLSRAKAVLWDRESPAERRKAALAERRRQQKKAKEVAKRLLGGKPK